MDADLIAALRPVRLPAAEGLLVADALAAFAIGLGAALLALVLLRLVARRRVSKRTGIAAELAAAESLAPPERLFVQAQLLDRIGAWSRFRRPADAGEAAGAAATDSEASGVEADISEALYRRDPAVDLDAIDQKILRLAARMRA